MARLSMYELLEKCCQFKEQSRRVEALRYNQSEAMKAILQYMFHPEVEFLLPDTDPPYTPSTFNSKGVLEHNIRKLNYFVRGGTTNMPQGKREMLFVQFLEDVDPQDAVLLLHLKEKKSPIKNLNKDIAIAAFPELFPT